MTKLVWKQIRWNEINPASEKPKLGRGTVKGELKLEMAANAEINGCHAVRRTEHGLRSVQIEGETEMFLLFLFNK